MERLKNNGGKLVLEILDDRCHGGERHQIILAQKL